MSARVRYWPWWKVCEQLGHEDHGEGCSYCNSEYLRSCVEQPRPRPYTKSPHPAFWDDVDAEKYAAPTWISPLYIESEGARKYREWGEKWDRDREASMREDAEIRDPYEFGLDDAIEATVARHRSKVRYGLSLTWEATEANMAAIRDALSLVWDDFVPGTREREIPVWLL